MQIMKALVNTTFFYSPEIARELQQKIKADWLPACASCGAGQPLCLAMAAEDGIERLAVQTPFNDRETAELFLNEIIAQMAGDMLRRFGHDRFTHFSTIMDIVDL